MLELLGNWLLLVAGGDPTHDKPTVTFAPPRAIGAEVVGSTYAHELWFNENFGQLAETAAAGALVRGEGRRIVADRM